jgi:hypothetical protein
MRSFFVVKQFVSVIFCGRKLAKKDALKLFLKLISAQKEEVRIPKTNENIKKGEGENEHLRQSSSNPQQSGDIEALHQNSNLEENGAKGENHLNSDNDENLGEKRCQKVVLQQLCIYYAMGMALICQGGFSICYHVCPTNHSLQFDTTIMYIMCILGIVKIYQVRMGNLQSLNC